MRKGTLFAGGSMVLITSFFRLQYLSNLISTGVLVALSMINLLLVLLRHKSLEDNLGLLERHLAFFNAISFLSGLLLMHVCTLTIGYALTCLCCLVRCAHAPASSVGAPRLHTLGVRRGAPPHST
jgi:hypothetical protein